MAWWQRVLGWLKPPQPELPPEVGGADSPEVLASVESLSKQMEETVQRTAQQHQALSERLTRIEALIAVARRKRIEDQDSPE